MFFPPQLTQIFVTVSIKKINRPLKGTGNFRGTTLILISNEKMSTFNPDNGRF
jgi:hypothetical protein